MPTRRDVQRVLTGAALVAEQVASQCGRYLPTLGSAPALPSKNQPAYPDQFDSVPTVQPLKAFVENAVPVSSVSRGLQFGALAASMAVGAVTEAARRVMQFPSSNESSRSSSSTSSAFLSTANGERLAAGLCRMRGAALKLGQMLSIQDESIVPPEFQLVLDRVRSSANIMPREQVERVLVEDLGEDWNAKFASFNFQPIAAASIGQVHRAVLPTGEQVVLKIQYPGVATSIKSDLINVKRLLQYTNVFPKGLYVDNLLEVAHDELSKECDYTLEAANQKKFAALISQDSDFVVPAVYEEYCSKRILTTDYVEGVQLDEIVKMSAERRNAVSSRLLRLCMNELFQFRFMQTDPNWANFLYNPLRDIIYLLDFGSCSAYGDAFLRQYLELVWACANSNRDVIVDRSISLGFLTGKESKTMMDAHIESAMVVGEPFRTETYDFANSTIPKRLSHLARIMLRERLTPPPVEAYTLHRKLSGLYLACIKLRAHIPCRASLEAAVRSRSLNT